MGPYTEQILERSSVSQLTQLFEIKRPPKSFSSTRPKMSISPPQDNTDVSTERIFIRHNHGRLSRNNKYRRELPKEVRQNMDNEIQLLSRKFSLMDTNNKSSRDGPIANMFSKLFRSRSDNQTENISTKSKADIEELRQKYRTDEVKRRNLYEKKNKEVREEKTRSFADAMNDEETEEYRKSLVRQMDEHIAHMKDDGFLDDMENDRMGGAPYGEDCDPYSPDESDFLNIMGSDKNSDDSQGTFRNSDDSLGTSRKSDDTQHTVYKEFDYGVHQSDDLEENLFESEEIENQTSASIGALNEAYTAINSFRNNCSEKDVETPISYNSDATEGMFIKVDVLGSNSSRLDDEFTESLGDDLESGLSIFEAFNDDGRELIEIQVVVDRRVVSGPLSTMSEELKNDMQQSDMVFFKNSDEICELIQENEKGAVGEIPDDHIYESVEYASPSGGHPEQNLVVYAPDSNRSTMYSTTSRDSSVFDEDDEGIEVGRPKQENEYVNVRRETYCDQKGIVRIERVARPDNGSEKNWLQSPVKRNDSGSTPGRLEYIIAEIRTTERKYFQDLTKVVNNFKPYIEKHSSGHLNDLLGYLFGNIEKIYRKQKKFLAAIEESGDEINKIVNCFLQHDNLFELYPKYFRNKPKADIVLKDFAPIIQDMQEHFEERLDFSAYLLTPVQRLGKYILFLENIEKELKKLDRPIGSAQMALDIVKTQMSKGNDYVAIESIQNSPISKLDYGSFKMRENFTILKPKKLESTVFLFTDIIVLTTVEPSNHETFNYYDSIRMEDLTIGTFENLTIHLTDYTKSKRKSSSTRFTHVLEAKSEKVWNCWREAIENVLWQQMYKIKEMTLTSHTKPKLRINKLKNRTKSLGTSSKAHQYSI